MHFLYTALIALTNNFDNISVRIAYSIRGIRISMLNNIWISAITFIISTSAAMAGETIAGTIGKQISSFVSMALLSFIGSYMIFGDYIKRNKNIEVPLKENKSRRNNGFLSIFSKPEDADIDDSKYIDFKEATFLGVALSINNIGGGLSAGMIGLNSFFIGLVSAIISFLALWAGNYMSAIFDRWKFKNKANIIAGIILILIGIKQVIV